MEPTKSSPPPRGANLAYRAWDDTLATLKADPGTWYQVEDSIPYSSGHVLRRRHGCRMTYRKNSDGTYSAWAMWPAAT